MESKDINKLFSEIGYIRGKVEKIDGMEKDIKDLKKKMNWIYGYASGIAATFTFVFYIIKEKLFGNG